MIGRLILKIDEGYSYRGVYLITNNWGSGYQAKCLTTRDVNYWTFDQTIRLIKGEHMHKLLPENKLVKILFGVDE